MAVLSLKQISITLSGSNQLRTSSEPASVVEFRFQLTEFRNRPHASCTLI